MFLGAYLAHSGDYGGLGVLRFFVVYRAVVRAKIHLLRAVQIADDVAERRHAVTLDGRTAITPQQYAAIARRVRSTLPRT